MTKTTKIALAGGLLASLLACCRIGMVVSLADDAPKTGKAAAPSSSATAWGYPFGVPASDAPKTSSSTPAASATKPAAPAPTLIEDGIYTVGEDIPAGVYKVTSPVSDGCYWVIYKSGTNGESIIANALPSGGYPKVALKKGQDFETERCGAWKKIG